MTYSDQECLMRNLLVEGCHNSLSLSFVTGYRVIGVETGKGVRL